MALTIETAGARCYVLGDTYAIRAQLKEGGAHWDADRKAWWIGAAKRAAVEALVAAATAVPQGQPAKRAAPGEDAVVEGRARYKGRTYYVAGRVIRGDCHSRGYDDRVEPIVSRDGSRVLLYFRDGSSQFWAACDQVEPLKRYDRPQTIARLAAFAERAKLAREQGYEDGIPDGATYECEECGERVTRGVGSCWETGCAH